VLSKLHAHQDLTLTVLARKKNTDKMECRQKLKRKSSFMKTGLRMIKLVLTARLFFQEISEM